MLDRAELLKIARARLRDASALLKAKRYDGSAYLCGYAIECALKARIVATLRWQGFPDSKKEFERFASFRTHNLDTLLSLSGREQRIKNNHLTEWSGVAQWDPEVRYKPIGSVTPADASLMIQRAQILLAAL
jgi:hypothetical protein